jgi:hypothetical protein
MASNRPSFYISEVGYPSPTSSQNLGSNPPSNGPKSPKKSIFWAKYQSEIPKNINLWFKNHVIFNYWA